MTKLILNYRPITLSSPFSKLGVKLGNPDFKSTQVNMTPTGRNWNYLKIVIKSTIFYESLHKSQDVNKM